MLIKSTQTVATLQKCNVAILAGYGNTHYVYGQQLMQLFLQAIDSSHLVYEPTLWQAESTKEAVSAKLSHILNQEFDVLLVLGQVLSLQVKAFYEEHDIEFPTIYLSTANPVKLGLVVSNEQCGGKNMAISAGPVKIHELADHLIRFKPYLSKICIPYSASDSAGSATEHALNLKMYLEEGGFEVYMEQVATVAEGLAFIKRSLPSVDSLFIFEGCVLIRMMPEIASLCWNNKVVFFAGAGPEGIDSGASCVYGGNLGVMVQATKSFLDEALSRDVCFGDLPVLYLEYERRLMINESMLLQFGIPLWFIEELKKISGVLVWRQWVNRPIG